MTDDMPTEDAFAHTLLVQQLFVRHQKAVLGYVLSLEPNLADAQDIPRFSVALLDECPH